MQYTVDDVFGLIGQFGWSQRTYFLLLGILQIFVAPQMLLNVFTGLDPTFECYEKNASSAAKPLINKCINNDPQECRISYTSEYKSFASEVCK
ncbi:solute carrier family 22 member 1-like [Penaeus monodon]|uniref:solute carrier family 22 member 1-like n=1 Tax=Penaeus monodon TaxID=6687 RepID=UPI0018A77C18|nr:solute carrier family 22 member 1-like [Penaeus monodon]